MTHPLDDWEWHYSGLDFGGETFYGTVKVDGLMGLPDVASHAVKRAGSHGYEPGRQLAGKRVGTIEIEYGHEAATDAELFAARDELLAAFHYRAREQPLTFAFPGGGRRRLLCRPVRLDAPVEHSWISGYGRFSAQVEAEDDPFWRSENESIASTGAMVASEGRTYPLVYSRLYGALGEGALINVVNEGNADTFWTARIDGPCVNPRLTAHSVMGAEFVQVDISLSPTQHLILDRRRETILLQGTAPRYELLASGSSWFDLPPGTTQVRYTSDDLQGTSQLSWRSAWW